MGPGYSAPHATCNIRTVLRLSLVLMNASGSAEADDAGAPSFTLWQNAYGADVLTLKPPSVMDTPGIAKPPDPRSGSPAPQGARAVLFGFYLPTRGPTATREGVLALAREGERLGLPLFDVAIPDRDASRRSFTPV